jgi:hypothetical protein
MAEHQVLFCPFCRDSFEGRKTCPAHDLALVTFERLAPADHERFEESDESEADQSSLGRETSRFDASARDDRPCGVFEPRHGRAEVALGALLVGAALPLELVKFPHQPPLHTYELARALPSLWTLGLVCFTALYALARRRTLRELRGLRVLVPALALVAPFTVGWLLYRRFGDDVAFGPAVYAVVLGSLLLLVGGLRLGAATRAAS